MTAISGTGELQLEQTDAAGRRDRRLEGFHPAYRRYIASLTTCSDELEDLADSFPAFLFALVSGYATPERRELAVDLICRGAPLREAADALGLAWWLRKLPAHSFSTPLPEFPRDAEFAFRISSLIPRDRRLAAAWLARVSHALGAGGQEYALWIARQPDLANPPNELFMFLAAWAWFSGRPGLLGHRLLRKGWTADMSFKRAREELAAWRQRLRLIECLGHGIESPWLADGAAAGFHFVALRTVDDFIAESEALENCLDQYADQLHTGLTAVFSIRRGSRRVACVEIGLHDEEASMPTIVQLRAARNRRAPPEVWQATFAWLGGQRLEPLSPERHALKPIKRVEARRQLWRPYLEFLEGSPHAAPFQHAVLQSTRERRRVGTLPRRLAELRPALEVLRPDARAAAQARALLTIRGRV
jgi:PcfJ-like protein